MKLETVDASIVRRVVRPALPMDLLCVSLGHTHAMSHQVMADSMSWPAANGPRVNITRNGVLPATSLSRQWCFW